MYIIRHKETKRQLTVASGKRVWEKPAHAKNAWVWWNHYDYDQERLKSLSEKLCVKLIPYERKIFGKDEYITQYRFPKFDEQDVYEIVEVKSETESELDKAKSLLMRVCGRLDINNYECSLLQEEIKAFLEGG